MRTSQATITSTPDIRAADGRASSAPRPPSVVAEHPGDVSEGVVELRGIYFGGGRTGYTFTYNGDMPGTISLEFDEAGDEGKIRIWPVIEPEETHRRDGKFAFKTVGTDGKSIMAERQLFGLTSSQITELLVLRWVRNDDTGYFMEPDYEEIERRNQQSFVVTSEFKMP